MNRHFIAIIIGILMVSMLQSQSYTYPALVVNGNGIDLINYKYQESTGRYWIDLIDKDKVKPGEQIEIYPPELFEVQYTTIENRCVVKTNYNGRDLYMPCDDLDKLKMLPKNDHDVVSFWESKTVFASEHISNLNNSWNYDIRNEILADVNNWVSTLQDYGLIYQDEMIDDYLSMILRKVYPGTLPYGRPGSISINVVISADPNAFALLDGRILITTGMLTAIRSEGELAAIIAHELAHVLKDHTVSNLIQRLKASQRAAFWTTLATSMAATAEMYMNARYDVYTGGAYTYLTYLTAEAYSNSIVEELGFKYSRAQEETSDFYAFNITKLLGYDSLSISTALSRLYDYNVENGNYEALVGTGVHPALSSRMMKLGKPKLDMKDELYLNRMANLFTLNARLELESDKYSKALELSNINIETGSATEMDYYVKAKAIRRLYDTEEYNKLAMELLQKAKSLSVLPFYELDKEIAITAIRLGQKELAISSLTNYIKLLETGIEDAMTTAINRATLQEEQKWAIKLRYRLEKGLEF